MHDCQLVGSLGFNLGQSLAATGTTRCCTVLLKLAAAAAVEQLLAPNALYWMHSTALTSWGPAREQLEVMFNIMPDARLGCAKYVAVHLRNPDALMWLSSLDFWVCCVPVCLQVVQVCQSIYHDVTQGHYMLC
jgi:hypothetical protein